MRILQIGFFIFELTEKINNIGSFIPIQKLPIHLQLPQFFLYHIWNTCLFIFPYAFRVIQPNNSEFEYNKILLIFIDDLKLTGKKDVAAIELMEQKLWQKKN